MVCVCFFSTWQFKCSCVLFTNLFCIQNPVGRHYFMQKKQKSQKCSSYFCVAKCSTLCEHVVLYAFMDLQQDYAVTEIKWKHKNGYLFFFFVVFLLSNKTCGKFLAVPSKKRSPDFSAVSNKSTGWHCDSSRKKKMRIMFVHSITERKAKELHGFSEHETCGILHVSRWHEGVIQFLAALLKFSQGHYNSKSHEP